MNKEVKVKVTTPFGLESIGRIKLQYETFGPLCCSVPPIAMVDDLLCISKCGINAFINSRTAVTNRQLDQVPMSNRDRDF